MRLSLLNLVFLLSAGLFQVNGQTASATNQTWNQLSNTYDQYKYEPITNRRFKHQDIMDRLALLRDDFSIRTVGVSNEGRELKLVSIGNGPVDVLMWSQMHGNEPTATMALMDVFAWLEDNENMPAIKEKLSSSLTMHFIPMLNPDGAQRFTRRNTQHIDINRDALRLQTPEGRTLKSIRDSLYADWGFNLHDQGRATTAVSKPATLSFLAPAYNFEREINEKREDAMQLIAAMNDQLQNEIPGQVGSYWDDFEPRAFGDNIQKWGTRTILIESGGQYKDREKQQIRKLNYLAIVSSLIWIADGSYNSYTVEDYTTIPANTRGMRDLILKNLQLPVSLGGYLTDIAFDYDEIEDQDRAKYYLSASIEDVGDLSTSSGYIVHDMSGYTISMGKSYDQAFKNTKALMDYGQSKLLKKGYTNVRVESPDYFANDTYLAVNKELSASIALSSNPSLLFHKEGELQYALINGYLIDLSLSDKEIIDGKKDL